MLEIRLKPSIALNGKRITQLQNVTCHMGSNSVTCHLTQVNAPHNNPSHPAGTQFTYPRRMEGWVELGSPIAARPGIESMTAWSQVQCLNPYATDWLLVYSILWNQTENSCKKLALYIQSVHCFCLMSPGLWISLSLYSFITQRCCDMFSCILTTFYRRDAMLARVFATATCLSVCLSVRHTPVLCLAERKQDREMYTVW